MGEPIKLEGGRIAHGQAQAAKMLTGFVGPQDGQGEAIAPEPLPSMPTDDEIKEAWLSSTHVAKNNPPENVTWDDIKASGLVELAKSMPEPAPWCDWTQVKGVSRSVRNEMNRMGLTSPAALLNYATMSGGDLTAIPGIGKARAAAIVAWAEGQL